MPILEWLNGDQITEAINSLYGLSLKKNAIGSRCLRWKRVGLLKENVHFVLSPNTDRIFRYGRQLIDDWPVLYGMSEKERTERQSPTIADPGAQFLVVFPLLSIPVFGIRTIPRLGALRGAAYFNDIDLSATSAWSGPLANLERAMRSLEHYVSRSRGFPCKPDPSLDALWVWDPACRDFSQSNACDRRIGDVCGSFGLAEVAHDGVLSAFGRLSGAKFLDTLDVFNNGEL